MTVLVTGATGFLGRMVVQELLDHHQQVRCLVHTPGRERVFPDRSVDVQYGNVSDPDALTNACQDMEGVIHLAAVIQQRRNATFDQINRQGTANVVAAANEAGGVKHIVLVSAIGATNNPSFRYGHSKWEGEQAVINGGLPYTIIRPSIIFGEGDAFLNSLDNRCQDMEGVIHLAAVIQQRRNATFDQINRQGTANVVAAANEAGGVKHIVLVSAIGATNNPSFRYGHSKWEGEQAVINGGLPYTIIRPSIIFGEGDAFLNTLAALVRVFPLVPVAGMGRNRFQPIAVADAARCIVQALDRDDLKGKTVEIGGPEQPSYNEIVALVAATLGKKSRRLHVPVWLMRLNVGIMELLLPRPPLTTEQLRMVTIRNVTELGAVEQTFGFTPRPLEGNIDFVNSVGFRDGLAILFGFMPGHIRDH